MLAVEGPVVVCNATSCLEVSTVNYPYTSWKVSWYHNAFENTAAVASGVEATFKALRRTGKIKKDYRFIAIGGDGGTYDIGLQAMSGMFERRHRVLYVCYDNNAYMNTGIQRSGATPQYAWTTTSESGLVGRGKVQTRKDIAMIAVAHGVPYVATAAVGSGNFWRDYIGKVRRALDVDGPSFIVVLAPCWRGWRYDQSMTLEIGRLAVDTCAWPLYEVVGGDWQVTYTPRQKKPIREYLATQGRFSHVLVPGNERLVEQIQAEVDGNWSRIQALTSMGAANRA
jgi:pyruvate ferredoxin oxidoreductase beta subunit